VPITEACNGNCCASVDVAAKIFKRIRENHLGAEDSALGKKVQENLRVCFIRHKGGQAYEMGKTIGMRAKHFVVAGVCSSIGYQKLYICDLAEWSVVIDDEAATKRIMKDYWEPIWEVSYRTTDADVEDVMDGLDPGMCTSTQTKKISNIMIPNI
jgi:hypothetical protein